MATRQDEQRELIDEGLEVLAEGEAESAREAEERRRIFEELAARVEQPGLQAKIIERYQSVGRTLLADSLPSRVDPRIARALRPILGDVSDVRVHTGAMATQAAQAMQARAFAIGDRDIFIDKRDFDPNTVEGGQLLAHEIAHTQDAATGFALSSRHGSSTAAREQFAHEVEFKFARELHDDGDNVTTAYGEQTGAVTREGKPKDPEIDKTKLAQKILAIIQRQEQSHSDRHGRW
jgi:hypothetical protein